METISNNNNKKVMDTITSQSPRRGPVRRGISPARRGLSPAARGRRTARGISPAAGGQRRSSSNSSRHSRTGSKDDVFIHGVAALL